MDKAIAKPDVIRMATGLGFRYRKNEKNVPSLIYSTPSGFAMEFPLQWLRDDGYYSMEQVSTQLNAMLKSARLDQKVYDFLRNTANVNKINTACTEYGLVYVEKDKKFYCVENGEAVFGVDHDYIASMICTGKASVDNLRELLDTFKETAIFEREQSIKASGAGLVGKPIVGKSAGPSDKKPVKKGQKKNARKKNTAGKKKARKNRR